MSPRRASTGRSRSGKPVSGEVVRTLRGHAGGVWGVDFRRDGRRIASFGEDRSIKLWDRSDAGTRLGAARQSQADPPGRPQRATAAGLPSGAAIRAWPIRRPSRSGTRPRDEASSHIAGGYSPWGSIALSPDGSLIACRRA